MLIPLQIKQLTRFLAILSAILLLALHAASAYATQIHSWVSHNGDDSNASCIITTPCATFGGALAQTTDGGEITCLDSGNFDAFNITISVVIDCRGTLTSNLFDDFLFVCGNNLGKVAKPNVINAPGKVVSLRGLSLNGLSNSLCGSNGIEIQAAAAVYVEDCVIENFRQKGILDERTSGLTGLVIKNTIIRNNGSAGIVAAAAPTNSVVLENVQSVGNTYGVAVATGNNVVISRSIMSENSVAGVEADPGAQVYVESTKISHNVSYGVLALGTVVLANSDITFNSSSISGATSSYGNNRLFGNGGGTAPTLIGQQ